MTPLYQKFIIKTKLSVNLTGSWHDRTITVLFGSKVKIQCLTKVIIVLAFRFLIGHKIMIHLIIKFAEDLIVKYGFAGVFAATMIEELVLIPSTLVMIASGFALLGGQPINLGSIFTLIFYVAVPIAFGFTLGSIIMPYIVVYKWGRQVIERFGKYVRISWHDVEKVQTYFNNNKYSDEAIILILRMIPIMPESPVSAFCGLIRMDVSTFSVLTFIGTFVRASIVGFMGWQFGRAYHRNILLFDRMERAIFLIIVLSIIVILFYHWRKSTNRGAIK